MVVGEKNRCVRITIPGASAAPFRGGSEDRHGQFQGQSKGRSPGV